MTALVARTGAAQAVRTGYFTALVVIAHPLVRDAVVRRLRGQGAREVYEAASVAEARARAQAVPGRELCVAQADLPDGSGLGLLAELRARGWSHAVVLAPGDDPYTVRAALAAGVKGYLVNEHTAAPEILGRVPIPRVPTRLGYTLTSGPDGLSAREVEVIQRVAEGRSNKDIGDALNLSALTVKSHLARIARKLGTGDRAEMVAIAMRAGIIS